METFPALLAICAGNSPVTGQWRGALMFSLICAWINGWVNNGEAGDLRRHRAHYDVAVMDGIGLVILDYPAPERLTDEFYWVLYLTLLGLHIFQESKHVFEFYIVPRL